MKKNIFFILTALVIITACNKQPDGVNVQGVISNGEGKTLYFRTRETVDSTIIMEKGEFSMNLSLPNPKFFYVYINPQDMAILVLDSLDQVTFNAEADNIRNTYTVEGSETSKQILQLQRWLDEVVKQLQVYRQQFENADSIDRDSLSRMLTEKGNSLIENHKQRVLNFIDRHPASLACLPAIFQSVDNKNFIFNYMDYSKYFHKVDSGLMAEYPELMPVKEFHAELLKQKQMTESSKNTQNGAVAPDVSLPDPQGNMQNLYDLRGKYVLLDFWASWCRPCRMENPNLVAVYNQYKDKGFDIFQVSIDRDKEAWIKAIQDDNLSAWHHVIDQQTTQPSPSQIYNVVSIPTNFLIDPDGQIIATNLRGQALGKTLWRVFNK